MNVEKVKEDLCNRHLVLVSCCVLHNFVFHKCLTAEGPKSTAEFYAEAKDRLCEEWGAGSWQQQLGLLKNYSFGAQFIRICCHQ